MNQTTHVNHMPDSNREAIEGLWPSLDFTDDYMFGAVLRSNPDLCRRLLESILDIPIERVEIITPQRESRPSDRGKSVRLDAYVQDGNGRVFDIEMQQYRARQLVKRARYYQAVLDTEQLDKGTSYQELPDTFVIFFCTFDPFGRGLRRYTYCQACREDGSFAPWDGSARVYLNAKGTLGAISDDLQGVLDYMTGHNVPERGLAKDIERAVTDVLSSEDRRREYVDMQLRMQDEHDRGREEGFAEGHAEGLEQGRQQGLEQGRQQGLEQGRQEGLEQGLEQGRAQGLQQGIEQGQEKALQLLARLSSLLKEAGRSDEFAQAISDSQKFEALCKEFDLK